MHSFVSRVRSAARLALLLSLIPAYRAGAEEPAVPKLPPIVSLADALALFRSRGFDLLVAEAAVASATGDAQAAAALPNPTLAGSLGRTSHYDPSACEGCSGTQIQGSVADGGLIGDLVIGKRRLRVAVANAALEAARHGKRDAERTLTFLVKQQYVQVASAKAAARSARESAKSSAETARLVQLRYTAGAVSEADAARAETDALQAARGVDAADAALASAKASLAFLLGARRPAADLDVADDLLEPPAPERLAGATAASLSELALAERPDVAAARAQAESARSALALAKRGRIPDVTLTGAYAQEGTSASAIQPPTASLGLSFALPVFYRQKGEITKAEAALRTQEVLERKGEAQAVADVASALAAWRSASSRVARMRDRLLDRAQRARDLVRIQYEKGAASLLELLDAQRTWIGVNDEYRQDLTDDWTALFQLEEAVGSDLR